MRSTLGSLVALRDAGGFVGRHSELALFDELFGDAPAHHVVLVHGPGGIGKSTLLREVARRGEARGWTPWFVEGRELPPVPDALEGALSGVRDEERPLVLFDTYERMTALDGYLRRGLLPSLSDRAIVVIAGRRPPDPAWFQGGWEHIAAEIALPALAHDEALELVRSHGMSEAEAIERVISWASGSPLALAMAADAGGITPDREGPGDQAVRPLIRRLADHELDPLQADTMAVAAIARVTTPGLLAAVLPDLNAESSFAWLAGRTFADSVAGGVALHDLVRRAMHADLRHRDPERERELRRRIADHLYERAIGGDLLLSIDLADLVENELIRSGFSWEGSITHRIDSVREGDAEELGRTMTERSQPAWWEATRRWFEEAPERVAIARDANDRMAGYLISVTLANAPELAFEDPLTGPWLEHARTLDGETIVFRDAVDLGHGNRERASSLQALINMAGMLRSGLRNPRYAFLPIDPDYPGGIAVGEVLGARHLPELDVVHGEQRSQCWLTDLGPGGMLGMQRAVVYYELGLVPPEPDAATAEAPAPAPPATGVDFETVRDALRNLQIPHELARSPLARGDTPEERAASVRTLIEDAAASAFGETDNERLLHRVLERGYLDPAAGHEQAADELHLSRAAYFRRLKAAAERLAAHLADSAA